MKRNILIGNIITYIATFLPVLILVIENPGMLRFDTFYNSCTTLAKIGGLAGIGLFALNIILSSRNKFLDRVYGGLDNVYTVHHDKGLVTSILLFLHPSFLALRELEKGIMAVILYVMPTDSLPVNFGKLALILFTLAMIFTVLRRFEYQRLQKIHKSLGVIFVIGAIHAFMVGSNVSTQPILRTYVGALTLFAVASYINTTLLGNILSKKYNYTVNSVESSENIIKIDIKPKGEKLVYNPGQFIFPSFNQKGLNEKHPFSIVNKPSDIIIKLIIRPLGDYTNRLKALKNGTDVLLEGPYGGFDYRKGGYKQIWVAGGIGITPFLSMIQQIDFESDNYTIDLFFSYSNEDDKVLAKDLEDQLSKMDNFRIFSYDTLEVSRLSVDKIAEISQDILDSDVFICGPIGMIESLEKQFMKFGVSKEKIHLERFKLL